MTAEPPGRSTFTIEGRSAPGLFVVGWLATLAGLGTILVGVLSGGGQAATVVFVVGMVILDVGLIAGAGSQAIERRARGREPYTGPSPVLVFLVSVVTVVLATVAVGLPLAAAGVELEHPLAELLLIAIHAGTYLGVTRLLVVGTGSLTWPEIGFRGDLRRVSGELLWGAVLAGPVIVVTAILASILVTIAGTSPPSPLPATGSSWGLLVNLLGGAVLAPVGEEVLFRGVATTAWTRSLGPRAGIIRGALLFAGVHILLLPAETFDQGLGMAAVGFLGRLPVALVLGWVYLRRGNLWAPIGLHAAFNGVLLVIAELAPMTA